MREKYIFLIGFGFGIVFITFIAFFVYNLNLKNNNDVTKQQLETSKISTEYVINL